MITKEHLEAMRENTKEAWGKVFKGLLKFGWEKTVDETFELAMRGLDFQWQPIKTAPKDGRTIIILVKGAFPEQKSFVRTIHWRHNNGEYMDDVHVGRITGWMPLPEPPKVAP